jgi:hypothetical protein
MLWVPALKKRYVQAGYGKKPSQTLQTLFNIIINFGGVCGSTKTKVWKRQ